MNKRLRSSEGISLLTLAVAGLSVAPFGASAQTSASSATVSVEPSVAEVVVTAQKRSERLVDVPISVAAVSANQLQQAGITDVMGLTQLVPGLRFDLQGAFVQPSIRGVNSSVAGPGLAAPIATYVDGFYYPDEIGANFELPDVASVEVSKGPQGTLFGRNATGGAISITTKAPSFAPKASPTSATATTTRFSARCMSAARSRTSLPPAL